MNLIDIYIKQVISVEEIPMDNLKKFIKNPEPSVRVTFVADSMARENYTDTQVWTIREWKEIEENRRYLA